jgi:shikimate kinase
MRDTLTDSRDLSPEDIQPEHIPVPIHQRPIALVGLMGVGKTTVGRRLAKALGRDFYDSDEEIERASGRTVAGYFRDHGEAAFRNGERRVVERLVAMPNIVLATGGGAFIHPSTHAVLQDRAIVVWMKGDFETIMERVSRKNTRPLLQVPDPRGRMRELMDERNPIYAKAHITISVAKGPHMRTVGRVERAVDTYIQKIAKKTDTSESKTHD